MKDLFLLDNGLGKPVKPKVHKKQAEGGHHRHQTKIIGGQKTGQCDRTEYLYSM